MHAFWAPGWTNAHFLGIVQTAIGPPCTSGLVPWLVSFPIWSFFLFYKVRYYSLVESLFVLTHMWGGSNVFLPFSCALLVTIENSPIPSPVFPSSSGVLPKKREQEPCSLFLSASTGPHTANSGHYIAKEFPLSQRTFWNHSLLILLYFEAPNYPTSQNGRVH